MGSGHVRNVEVLELVPQKIRIKADLVLINGNKDMERERLFNGDILVHRVFDPVTVDMSTLLLIYLFGRGDARIRKLEILNSLRGIRRYVPLER